MQLETAELYFITSLEDFAAPLMQTLNKVFLKPSLLSFLPYKNTTVII